MGKIPRLKNKQFSRRNTSDIPVLDQVKYAKISKKRPKYNLKKI